ncbi:hypothetical protein EJ076_18510 [Mesorhizobium sp. M7D.F.Ca.US.005.01.1.1]|uniref:hypothetical protein n=1 Tax=Mesorhizobium sp. M7D.F.Ca.US.005.01.1.1 TaxID=2493678 RepID=UPI000F75C8DB|nr:hypothetical protein [Mesorhizobium sp. M7D.F.Ca.US.005.01.1.1]AZO42947.1 hypothetical protein EJ076_18510 [Mesorhizobium sp. M7D.F.Ca.US.005.01.1.1]
MRYTGILLALVATTAIASDRITIDPVEFMVTWPDLVCRDVVITKGRIAVASDAFMILQLPGGNVTLKPPWLDRDDLRPLFEHCTSVLTDDRCDVAAEGTVGKVAVGNGPQLEGVDFSLAGSVGSGAHPLVISREQCELVREELITSMSNYKASQEALRRAQIAMIDLVSLNFELQHLGGEHDLSPITDRVQKAIDEVSAANKYALAARKDNSAKGAIAFMNVCGPPPG